MWDSGKKPDDESRNPVSLTMYGKQKKKVIEMKVHKLGSAEHLMSLISLYSRSFFFGLEIYATDNGS